MAAPVFTGNPDQMKFDGPGVILMAPYASDLVLPTFASTASAFTNSWDAAWQPVGYTDDGFQLDLSTTTTDVEAAESLYPIAKPVTRKDASVKFTMLQNNKFNIARAMNGGTFTVTGSTGTKVTKYSPPVIGGELRSAVAWLSSGQDESIIVYKVFQSGSLSIARKKVGTKWQLACDFGAEVPSPSLSTDLFNVWYAGIGFDA